MPLVSGGSSTSVRNHSLKIGGLLYVVATFQFFVFELVAETLYHGYSVASNYISDLGATCINPPSNSSCVVHQPSAQIFDATVFLLGLILLVGAFCVYRGTRKKPYFVISAIADLSILLIGVFPENTGWIHAIVSEVAFLFTGVSLILATTIVAGGIMRYLAVSFGILTVFFTLTDVPANIVGVGGQERMLVLSALLGLLALGGYLTSQDSPGRAAGA